MRNLNQIFVLIVRLTACNRNTKPVLIEDVIVNAMEAETSESLIKKNGLHELKLLREQYNNSVGIESKIFPSFEFAKIKAYDMLPYGECHFS